MEEALQNILINTYNPDHNLRFAAEAALKQFLATNGSLSAMMNCIARSDIHPDLRQATTLLLKNHIRDYWAGADKEKALPTSLQEKEYVKTGILQVLLDETNSSIRSVLAESILIISQTDFPDNWPELMPTLLSNVQSENVLRIFNSLTALRKVIKRFEFKDKGDRSTMNNILQVSFPLLQQLMTQIITNNSIEAAQVMRLCLKIFYSATVYVLPQVSGVDVNMWFQMIADIINKPLPEAEEGLEPAGQPKDPEDRKAWPWWKLKKWATRIMSNFIQRYGNPKHVSDENEQFANYFKNNTSILFIGPVMNNLLARSQGKFVSDHVFRECLTYLVSCAEMSPSYKVMKPHLNFLITQVIFPCLCLSAEDLQTFEDDPNEFIRKVYDPLQDWISATNAATNLLQMLARYRKSDTMPIVLPFLQSLLVEYSSLPPEQRNYTVKDGVMTALSALVKIMLDSKDYRAYVLPILVTHIIPEFDSPVAFIRARACFAIEFFSIVDWTSESAVDTSAVASTSGTDKKKKKKKNKGEGMTVGQVLQSVLAGLLKCLRDPSLPVQAASAVALRSLISEEGATDLLLPSLPHIINEYFRIMEEVGNESVLSALENIIEEYGERIADISVMLVAKLTEVFMGYVDDTEDEEATWNASQALSTIASTIEAVETRDDLLLQMEPILLPIMHKVLTDQNGMLSFEYIDSVVHFIGLFTYSSAGISPAMWSLCGPLLSALNSWAIDYITDFLTPLLNYITKDPMTFVVGQYGDKTFLDIFFDTVVKILQEKESYNGRDHAAAAMLTSAFIVSAKVKHVTGLTAMMPQILALTLNTLGTAKAKYVRVRLVEIVLASFYYDAGMTLAILESAAFQKTAAFFTLLFELLKEMERDFSMRITVLAFSSLLVLPVDSLPEIVRNNAPAMFQQSIRELVLIEEVKEENDRKEAERAAKGDDDEDDEDDDDDDFGGDFEDEEDDDFNDADAQQAAVNRAKKLYVPDDGYGEDDDCVNCEDEEYRQLLEDTDKDERVKRELYRAGEPVDDEDNDDDFDYTSEIELMDITGEFLGTFTMLQQQNPALVAQLQSVLDGEDHERVQQLFAKVQMRQAQQQQQQGV